MTYTPLQPGQAPSIGTSGDAVKDLQTLLNTQNANTPGYVPLKVDGQYGPLTQAATQTTAAPVAQQPAAPAQQAPQTTPAAAPAPVAAPAAPTQPASPSAPVAPTAAPAAQAPAPALSLTAPLQSGSRGAEVSQVQKLLGITTDGDFGPQTDAAVKAFQAANGLTVDGIIGPQTLQALNESAAGPSVADNVTSAFKAPDDRSNQFNTDNGQPNPNFKPEIPSTGNAQIDSLIKVLNNQSPQKSFTDIYKEIYSSLGLDTMKADYTAQTKAYSDLQKEKQDKIDDINNNPWYSEGVRVNKLRSLDTSYEARESTLTNKLKLLETTITNNRADAQFVAGKVMDQLNQSHKLNDDIIMKAIDIAEKQAEAEHNLAKPVSVGNNSRLINPKTGEVVTPSSGTSSPSSTETQKKATTFASSKLEVSRGTDGFVDPYVYKEAYDGWVNGHIDAKGVKQPPLGTTAQFLSKFPPKNYINPAATSIKNLLPTFLQNNPKSSSSRSLPTKQ